jgi:putative ABC transport system permease protein
MGASTPNPRGLRPRVPRGLGSRPTASLARIALRNARANRARAALTVLGAAVAVVAFMLMRTMVSAWSEGAVHGAKDRLATRHRISLVTPLPLRYVDVVRETPGVRAASFSTWFGGKDPRKPNFFFMNLAVEPESFLAVYDEIILSPEERAAWLADRQGAILGDALAERLGVHAGDTLSLESPYPGPWQFHIAGVYHAAKSSFDRSQFFMRWDYFNEHATPRNRDKVGWIISRVDPASAAATIRAIDAAFEDRDAPTTTMDERALQASMLASASAIFGALDVASALLLVILTLVLGNTLAMGVRERTNEYGVLLALGFSPQKIVATIACEALALGLVAGVTGVAVAHAIVAKGLAAWLEKNLGGMLPNVHTSPALAASAVLAAALLATGAALPAAVRASRLSPSDALRRVD